MKKCERNLKHSKVSVVFRRRQAMTITFRLVKSNRHGTKLRVEKKEIYNFKTGR